MKLLWGPCALLFLVICQTACQAATDPIDVGGSGQQSAAGVVGVFTKPPANVPSRRMPDGAILGNGDLGITVAGPADALTFYLGKADFFGVLNGGVSPAGTLNLSIPHLRGATTYHMEQRIGPAKLVGDFISGEGCSLELQSWVSDRENLLVIEMHNAGNRPLDISSRLLDRLGTPGNQATFSADGNVTMLAVSPDTLDLQLGNPSPMHHPPEYKAPISNVAFKGTVADFRIYDRPLDGAALKTDESVA